MMLFGIAFNLIDTNFFFSNNYRSFRLIYDSIVNYRGIRLYRFALDPELFISGDIDGNNKGFCVMGKKCLPSGVMDLSHCDPTRTYIYVTQHMILYICMCSR
jgi:hypothetical protein